MAQTSFVGAIFCAVASAQFVPPSTAIPRTSKLPVVFLNGYQADCPGTAGDLNSFRSTFGTADEILQTNGQVTLFFDNCSVPNRPAIEMLGRSFGEFLERLRYSDGQAVPQVDVVVHSMGGLIVRSYLAGKQLDEATFSPPVNTRIRKVVFLGTPHFGTPVTGLSPDRNKQIEQLEPGSRFLFDLATWNQGIDDMRGANAIAVLGNAGNGTLGNIPRFHDSTVKLTSGSLGFVIPDRTRIVNYCHTGGLAELLCSGQEGRLTNMTSDTHLSARIVTSFLNGTDDWRSIGQSAGDNSFLTTRRGLVVAWRDASDRPMAIQSASIGQERIDVRSNQIAYSDFTTAQAVSLTLTGTSGTASTSLAASSGFTQALIIKAGPSVAGVFPVFARLFPRSVAPGMFISIYGSELGTTTMAAPGLPYPTMLGTTEVRLNGTLLPLHYAAPGQVNAVMPENATGLAKLTVKTAGGEQTVNLLVEPAVPAVFGSALNALTGATVTPTAPLQSGDYVALFLTGLGATVRREGLDWAVLQPDVEAGGSPCEVIYAGRAPGYVGLDQINCRLAPDLPTNSATPLSVRSGNRVSNTITLALR